MMFATTNAGNMDLYEGERSNRTDYYVWTDSESCTRYVGYFAPGRCGGSATIRGAGTLTSSAITLEYDGIIYTATVPTITINNAH